MKPSSKVSSKDKKYEKDSHFKNFESTILRKQVISERRARKIRKEKGVVPSARVKKSKQKGVREIIRKINKRKAK